MEDRPPIPEPAGDRAEPPRRPPTALATGTPEPENSPKRITRGGARPPGPPIAFVNALNRVLDVLDEAAEVVRASARRLVG